MTGNKLNVGLAQFCEWHDSFKKGILATDVGEEYMQVRNDVCNFLLMAQRLAIEPEAAARGALRVARAYQIELGFSSNAVNSITYDISTSGLSALVAEPPPMGTVVSIRLKIGGGTVIVGRGQVVKILPKQGNTLTCLSFEGLPAEAREKIETVVCDVIVTELRSHLRPRQHSAN